MVRWELYVNFFYSWIIFSLRCHQVEFSALHWNEYSSQSYSFWKTDREKEKKALNPFSSPSSCSSEHARLPWISKAAHSIHVLLGMGPELSRCPLMWDQGVTTNVRIWGGWGLQEQWEQWGAALVVPQGHKGTRAHHGQSEPFWEGEQLQSSFGLLSPGPLWAVLQHCKKLQISKKMDKMALMGEWNSVDIWTGGKKFMK